MDYNGSNVVIYGPEMSRSMYTVCKQILGHKISNLVLPGIIS